MNKIVGEQCQNILARKTACPQTNSDLKVLLRLTATVIGGLTGDQLGFDNRLTTQAQETKGSDVLLEESIGTT
jgi:hypothetical protein